MKRIIPITLSIILALPSFALAKNPDEYLGKDPTETSFMTAKNSLVTLVNKDSYADAMSAINVNAHDGSSLIFYNRNLDLNALKGKEVKIVGGEKQIPKQTEDELKKIAKNVTRLSGRNRYETNRKTLAREAYLIVNGNNPTDASLASSYMELYSMDIYLVDGNKPYPDNSKFQKVLGGKSSVKYANYSRISGRDRYETAKAIIQDIDPKTIALASTWQDAMLAQNLKIPVALINEKLPYDKIKWINNYEKVIIGKDTKNHYEQLIEKYKFKPFYKDPKDYKSMEVIKIANGYLLKNINMNNPAYIILENANIVNGQIRYGSDKVSDEEFANLMNKYIPQVIREADIEQQDSDYTKALKVILYLNNNSTYRLPLQSPFDIPNKGEANCQGANALFRLIMLKLGIPAVEIIGMSPGGLHNQTEVYINGEWMRFDATPEVHFNKKKFNEIENFHKERVRDLWIKEARDFDKVKYDKDIILSYYGIKR